MTAVMEGKLKEKLESVGLALLSLAMGKGNPMDSWGEGGSRGRRKGRRYKDNLLFLFDQLE